VKFLFLSTHSTEALIEKTQLYCRSKGIEVVRINLEDLIPNTTNSFQITMQDNDVSFVIQDQIHHLSDFSLVWKRRISDNFLSPGRVFETYGNSITIQLKKELTKEIYEVRDLLLHYTRKLKIAIVNDYDPICLSKPFQSITASDFHLKVPSTLVSNSMSYINSFIASGDSITKAMFGLGYFVDEKHIMSIKTTSLDLKYTESVSNDSIFPSFLQKQIKSKYELKCILVGEQLHCIKQYSEDGYIPTTDIKEAYRNKQITNVEYTLNEAVKSNVIKMCKYFKLDLCTMDIIRNTDEEYVFIEINPDGIIEYYSEFLTTSIHESIYQLFLKKLN